MIYNYEIYPAAQKDYLESIDWYLARSESATEKFVAIVKKTIANICRDPKIYKCHYKHYREVTVSKFPFTIVYSIDEAKHLIYIIAIYHQNRNPKLKYR